MKDITKKVVILNNFSSPYISEAIIVLREYNPKLEGKIIADAEKIVSDYIEQNTVKIPKKMRQTMPAAKKIKRKNRPHITAPVLAALAALAVAGIYLHFTS